MPHLSIPLSIALVLALSGVLGCAPKGKDRSTKAERIETELSSVRAALAECRLSGLSELIHGAVVRTLELPDQIEMGRYIDLGDWIVLRDELQCIERGGLPAKGQDPAQVARRKELTGVVKGYADALAERGADLLMVLIPTRVQVYPDRLQGVPRIDEYRGFDAGYLQLLHDLLEAGIEVIDLLPPFFAQRFDESGENDPLLYRDFDTHWTPRGATLCADIVSERIRQYDWFEPGPGQEGVDFVVRRESRLVQLRPTPTHEDHHTTFWFECVQGLDGQPARLGGAETPILLLGDSFSDIYSYPQGGDLARLIYARLGWKIDVIRVRGGGVNSVWSSLARRSEVVRERRLVLWVVSARTISSTPMQAIDIFSDDR